MQEKLNLAIVGCGAVAGYRHMPAFKRIKKHVNFQTTCDRNIHLADTLAQKHEFHVAYADLAQMLHNEPIDMVDICTPPATHANIAIEVMENGCDVLIEKPMASTVDECKKMIVTAKAYRRKLCVIHNVLFHKPLLDAKSILESGIIGDFRGMRILLSDPRAEMITRSDYWVHKLKGGVIGETGPHPIYISQAFIGDIKNVEVFARNYENHPWAPFDEFRIELEGEKGFSSVMISYSGNRYAAEVEMFGSEGAIYCDLQSMLTIVHPKKENLNKLRLVDTSLDTAKQIIFGLADNALDVITGRFKVGHDVIIERFVDSCLNDTPLPVTGEEGMNVIKTLEMIVDSLNKKYA
jgi:predicted dehydrogenase